MTATLRFLFRLVATVLFCIACWFLAVSVNLLTIGNSKWRYRIRCPAMSFWGYTVARIWGMKIRVHGTPPPDPSILVSNHLGYTDIVLMCATCPRWFISKSEVANWPGIGALTRSANTLFINRALARDLSRMNATIQALLDDGASIAFYPEGTSTDGSAVAPFKPSLLQPAAASGLPVHYAAITYRTPPGCPPPSEVVCWHGDMAFGPHAKTLFKLPRFYADIRFHETPIAASDRKELAQELHTAVSRLHQELVATVNQEPAL